LTRQEAVDKALPLCETLPIQMVARNLYEAHPHLFTSVDQVRSMLRYRRGSFGDKNRRTAHIVEPKLSTIAEGLSKLQAIEQVKETPLIVDSRKSLIVSDIHFPYHSEDAVCASLEYGKEHGVDHIHLNGDTLDFHECSDFEKDPRAMPLYRELEMVNQFLDFLQAEFPNAKITFKYGNHEDRLSRYIRKNAAAVEGMKGVTVHEQLDLDGRGIEWRKYERVQIGKLCVLHGHERKTPFNNVTSPALTMFRWANESTLVGHHHQISEYVKPSLSGTVTGCYSTGCLCNLKPAYNYHALTWAHGFATVDVDTEGYFTVHNHRIVNGHVR
jgi:predicted phosphodiesterase